MRTSYAWGHCGFSSDCYPHRMLLAGFQATERACSPCTSPAFHVVAYFCICYLHLIRMRDPSKCERSCDDMTRLVVALLLTKHSFCLTCSTSTNTADILACFKQMHFAKMLQRLTACFHLFACVAGEHAGCGTGIQDLTYDSGLGLNLV